MIPIVVGALGTIPLSLKENLKTIDSEICTVEIGKDS